VYQISNGQLIYSEVGNSTDYFNIGASIDLVEVNFNHAVLFYTSSMILNGMNYTHINHVHLLRFINRGNFYFSNLTIVNDYRDRTNDSQNLGRIGFSISNQILLLTMEWETPSIVKFMPLCTFTENLIHGQCQPCPEGTFAAT